MAQQSNKPLSSPAAGKSEEEIREEEELQLALALSQSEAEENEKQKKKRSSIAADNKAATSTPSDSNTVVNGAKAMEKAETSVNAGQDVVDFGPELMRYLNREFWEKQQNEASAGQPSGSAMGDTGQPRIASAAGPSENEQLDEFVTTLKTQVEIFVNRMKSNSSRGRAIVNDSSVQTLFMNSMAMHSHLLKHIQQQEDKRVHFEGLQDKLTQVRDARAALNALREEELERKRREAQEAERLRQIQMQEKLEVMRKKKNEYLQYQRQLALQRMQEQEREMLIRQEQMNQQQQQQQQASMMPVQQQQQEHEEVVQQQQQAYGAVLDQQQFPPSYDSIQPGSHPSSMMYASPAETVASAAVSTNGMPAADPAADASLYQMTDMAHALPSEPLYQHTQLGTAAGAGDFFPSQFVMTPTQPAEPNVTASALPNQAYITTPPEANGELISFD